MPNCPDCGADVPTIFEHVDRDCLGEASMKATLAEIADTAPVIVMAGWEPEWQEMARGTLGHFFAENSMCERERDAIRSSLAECGQYEGGGGAAGRYTLVLDRAAPNPCLVHNEHDHWIDRRKRGAQEDA